jgi:nifR3 family TIM-barrel protein
MQGFWQKLKKPIFVLAPMADVTDVAFRRMIAEVAKPDVMWTEFTSADGLALAPEEGRKKLLKNLEYDEIERPIVAQFFTSSPEHMLSATKLAQELGFDGVDINMGCPDRSVEKQGAGASLMKNVSLARELVRAAKEGAPDLPISVKTRTGYSKPDLENWLPEILKEDPAVVTIHARTRKEMSKVPARWEYVKRAVEIRNESGKETLIFGNGDVRDLSEAQARVDETGCDGVMLGRAIFGNPWLFANLAQAKRGSQIEHPDRSVGTVGAQERLKVLVRHTKLFEELLGGFKSFAVMKKHFKSYVTGFDKAGDLREKLMQTNNAQEVETIINKFLL